MSDFYDSLEYFISVNFNEKYIEKFLKEEKTISVFVYKYFFEKKIFTNKEYLDFSSEERQKIIELICLKFSKYINFEEDELKELLKRCLQKNIELSYNSIEDLRKDFLRKYEKAE